MARFLNSRKGVTQGNTLDTVAHTIGIPPGDKKPEAEFTDKSVLIVHSKNIEARKLFWSRHGFKVWMGTRYFVSYISDGNSKHYWLKNCTELWERNICTIRKTSGKYPQESYAVVVHAIRQ